MFLGVPFNLAFYAMLTHMLAWETGYEVGELIWTGGDCHIYDNHRDQVAQQLEREPRPLPQLQLNPPNHHDGALGGFTQESFIITGYNPHPPIKAPVAV